jgi:mevalonate kinase
MGSGASISSSIVKELAKFFQIDMNKQEIYNLVMEIEKNLSW